MVRLVAYNEGYKQSGTCHRVQQRLQYKEHENQAIKRKDTRQYFEKVGYGYCCL